MKQDEFLCSYDKRHNDSYSWEVPWIQAKGWKDYFGLKRIIQFCHAKIEKYGFNNYPSNTLLVLDDLIKNIQKNNDASFWQSKAPHSTKKVTIF